MKAFVDGHIQSATSVNNDCVHNKKTQFQDVFSDV